MENHSETPKEGLQNVFSILSRIAWRLYGITFWAALAIQILFSIFTWNNTVTYDYFCGNPLMGYWAQWFVISLIVGVLMLPGGVWSIRHRSERMGIIYIIGFLLYILGMIAMTIIGVIFKTIPDFIHFIDYAFG